MRYSCNGGEFSEDSRGKYMRCRVIFDEDYHDNALDWVGGNSSVKLGKVKHGSK